MERKQAMLVEKFVEAWNAEVPECPLQAADLTKPHAVVGATLHLLDRLGIDRDAVTAVPEECVNEHTVYYYDLIPVINMTRVIYHLVSVIPQMDHTVSITYFLQPEAMTSRSILFILFNLLVFNEDRVKAISPYEQELFDIADQVKVLEDRKCQLSEMLNEQALEKGKRAERLNKCDLETKQYEEELKVEKEAHDEEKQILEAKSKENRHIEMVLEQKTSQKEALMAEVARKRALRVYDADDIKAQAEQAAQNVQEAEEKLNSLRTKLMQKESSLKNLQTIKPNLDTANNLLHEIMKLSDNLKDLETGDLDTESAEGELDVLETEVGELSAQLAELAAARGDAARRRRAARAARQGDAARAHSSLREAEEKDRKLHEKCKKALQRTDEIKAQTAQYELDKAAGFEQLAQIKTHFCTELKSMEELLLKKATEVANKVEDRVQSRKI